MAKLGKISLIVAIVLGALITAAVIGARHIASTPAEIGLVPGTTNVYIGSNNMVRVFLIDLGAQAVLIDAGVDVTGNVLQALVAKAGKTLNDITTVFITHGHNDHFSGMISLPSTVTSYIGADDAALMEGLEQKHNIPGLVLNNLFQVHYAKPTKLIEKSGDIPLPDGSNLLALHAPGHTQGTYLFFYNGVLFIGDAFNYNASDNKLEYPPAPVTEDMPLTIKAISQLDETLQGLDIKTVCTSHGGCTPPEKTQAQLKAFIAQAKKDL